MDDVYLKFILAFDIFLFITKYHFDIHCKDQCIQIYFSYNSDYIIDLPFSYIMLTINLIYTYLIFKSLSLI